MDHDLTKQSLARVMEGQAQSISSAQAVLDGLAEQLKSLAPNSSLTRVPVVDAGFLGLAKVFLKGSSNSWFVGTDGQYGVHCNSSYRRMTEEIIIKRNRSSISLKSCHGCYLSAQRDGKLVWNRSYIQNFEKFDIVVSAEDPNIIRLKSFHGKWVSAQPDGRMVADCGDEYALDASVYFTVCGR